MGIPSVNYLLGSLSASELIEWETYFSLEPFGYEVEDLRMGQICATVANVNRPKGKKPFSANDFRLIQKENKESDLLSKVRGFVRVYQKEEKE